MQLQNPKMDLQIGEELLSAIRLLVREDPCNGRFVYGRQERPKSSPKPATTPATKRRNSKNPLPTSSGGGGDNAKSQLQILVVRAGHNNPLYKTKQLSSGHFR
jgi:ATP-dependent RNA helicase DHX36